MTTTADYTFFSNEEGELTKIKCVNCGKDIHREGNENADDLWRQHAPQNICPR